MNEVENRNSCPSYSAATTLAVLVFVNSFRFSIELASTASSTVTPLHPFTSMLRRRIGRNRADGSKQTTCAEGLASFICNRLAPMLVPTSTIIASSGTSASRIGLSVVSHPPAAT